MRTFLLIAAIGVSRLASTGVSKTYGLSIAVKDGICVADQEAGADGVSVMSVPTALEEAVTKITTQTEQPDYDCRGAEIPAEKKDYVGDWTAPGRILSIASSGKVHYKV